MRSLRARRKRSAPANSGSTSTTRVAVDSSPRLIARSMSVFVNAFVSDRTRKTSSVRISRPLSRSAQPIASWSATSPWRPSITTAPSYRPLSMSPSIAATSRSRASVSSPAPVACAVTRSPPSFGGRRLVQNSASGLVDLASLRREDVPLGAELVEALAVRVARARVTGVAVERVPVVGHLHRAVGALAAAEQRALRAARGLRRAARRLGRPGGGAGAVAGALRALVGLEEVEGPALVVDEERAERGAVAGLDRRRVAARRDGGGGRVRAAVRAARGLRRAAATAGRHEGGDGEEEGYDCEAQAHDASLQMSGGSSVEDVHRRRSFPALRLGSGTPPHPGGPACWGCGSRRCG